MTTPMEVEVAGSVAIKVLKEANDTLEIRFCNEDVLTKLWA